MFNDIREKETQKSQGFLLTLKSSKTTKFVLSLYMRDKLCFTFILGALFTFVSV